jgi:hypothetical protein
MTSSALATHDDRDDLRVFSLDGFEMAQRMAKSLASSTLVPKIYQGQEGLANCLIALELSSRMKISPMVVMQNMVPIYGRPSWSSQFLIGTVNACGRFSPLRYIFDNEDEPTSCYCEAKDIASGEILRGEKITIAMAKAQGWWSRKDSKGAETSKWPTMTGQMLRFRAASWWVRVFCPEISLGLGTQEEAIDVEAVVVTEALAPALPAVPAPLTHRAEDVAEVEAPAPEPEPAPGPEPQGPNSEATPSSPNLEASPPNLGPSSLTLEPSSGLEQPAPATEPGTAQRLPQGRTTVAADPQPAPAPAPVRRSGPAAAPAPVRRSGPAAAPAAEAPIPGLD